MKGSLWELGGDILCLKLISELNSTAQVCSSTQLTINFPAYPCIARQIGHFELSCFWGEGLSWLSFELCLQQ